MPATTTSSQPMPLAPINTRSRSDSNGLESPISLMSSLSSGSPPLTPVFTASSRSSGSSDEEPSMTTPIAPLIINEKTVRPHHTLHHTQIEHTRDITESVDYLDLGRCLTFNDFSRGRHSNLWLFGSVSVRRTIKDAFSKMITKH